MNCISHNRFGLAIVACLFSLSLWAEVPAGYYDAAVGKSGEELQKSLSTILNNADNQKFYLEKVNLMDIEDGATYKIKAKCSNLYFC